MDLSGKSVMILGEGISGKGAMEALKNVAVPFFYTGLEEGASPDLIVTSPGIVHHPVFDYAAEREIPLISELELGYLLNKTPIAAVTGTNGKTTVAKLLGDMLSMQYKSVTCGNIGFPLSLAAMTDHEVVACEASSFQLERCYEFHPAIAIITNISQDHLDRHGTMENYIKIKLRIAARQTEDDYLICPSELRSYLGGVKSKIIYSDKDCDFCGGVGVSGKFIIPAAEIPLSGAHNLMNVAQAALAASILGISAENIRRAVAAYAPDNHRMQLAGNALGKNWYDDSKATNIGSCLAACRSVSGKTALILGGSDKGYEYDELFVNLPAHIKYVYVMGEVKDKLLAAARRAGRVVITAQNLTDAVEKAAKTDTVNVLLSPAAASFDSYKDYKARGEDFLSLVKSLGGGK